MYNNFDNSLLVFNTDEQFFVQVSLKCKLASESSKVVDQRDKIQQLQNELIRVSYRPLSHLSG